jgi:hypothetical protein
MPEIPQALVGCGDADVAWLDQRGLLLSSLGMKLDLRGCRSGCVIGARGHQYVRHGDGVLPWCEASGFTDAGLHRCELVGEGKAARRAR